MKELFISFTKSVERLAEVLEKEKTAIVRDASILRFEFTVELAWKCLQKFLRNEKIDCRSPKECLKQAFKFGLIEDNPLWIKMLDDRNLAVHTYNEKVAEEVYGRIPPYLDLIKALSKKLTATLE